MSRLIVPVTSSISARRFERYDIEGTTVTGPLADTVTGTAIGFNPTYLASNYTNEYMFLIQGSNHFLYTATGPNEFDGQVATFDVAPGTSPVCARWANTKNWLAIGFTSSPYAAIYKYVGGGAFEKIDAPFTELTGWAHKISFSPSDARVAVANRPHQFYNVSGESLSYMNRAPQVNGFDIQTYDSSWRDENWIGIAHNEVPPVLSHYEIDANEDVLPKPLPVQPVGNPASARSAAWNSLADIFVVGTDGTSSPLGTYSFDPGTEALTRLSSPSPGTSTNINSAIWEEENEHLVVSFTGSNYIYRYVSGSGYTFVDILSGSTAVWATRFDPPPVPQSLEPDNGDLLYSWESDAEEFMVQRQRWLREGDPPA